MKKFFVLSAVVGLAGLGAVGCGTGDNKGQQMSSEACAAILTNPVAQKTAPKDYDYCMDRLMKSLKTVSKEK